MTPSLATAWFTAFGAGVLSGLLFFGGLWWTIKRALSSSRPHRWFLGSLPVRASLVLAGFHLGASGDGTRLLFCLLGFVLARGLVVRVVRFAEQANATEKKEAADGAQLRSTDSVAVRPP